MLANCSSDTSLSDDEVTNSSVSDREEGEEEDTKEFIFAQHTDMNVPFCTNNRRSSKNREHQQYLRQRRLLSEEFIAKIEQTQPSIHSISAHQYQCASYAAYNSDSISNSSTLLPTSSGYPRSLFVIPEEAEDEEEERYASNLAESNRAAAAAAAAGGAGGADTYQKNSSILLHKPQVNVAAAAAAAPLSTVLVLDDFTCPLCMDILNEPLQCVYGHAFCAACITQVLLLQGTESNNSNMTTEETATYAYTTSTTAATVLDAVHSVHPTAAASASVDGSKASFAVYRNESSFISSTNTTSSPAAISTVPTYTTSASATAAGEGVPPPAAQCPVCRVNIHRHTLSSNLIARKLIERLTVRCYHSIHSIVSSSSSNSSSSSSSSSSGGRSSSDTPFPHCFNAAASTTTATSTTANSSAAVSAPTACSWQGPLCELRLHLSSGECVSSSFHSNFSSI